MSNDAEPNYFTCTLGQAVHINKGEPQISNINDFIDHQAATCGDKPAVGFAVLGGDKTAAANQSECFSFRDVQRGSSHVARILEKSITRTASTGQTTVALLCPSTPEFLLVWLGLMRLGHAVLLIAPQCQPAAIAHLCQTCEVVTLFYDETYAELAQASGKVAQSEKQYQVDCVQLALSTTTDDFRAALKTEGDIVSAPKLDKLAVGYLHHTSGTSSGLPKPIPQSHHAGLGVLPRFRDGSDKATFTTTPLYHGGVADTFRAWASNAMIWLFPGGGPPITAKNIVSCLDVAESKHKSDGTPAVKYFASVPYVLQMMAADARGMKYLQDMDIVGVGGAALPAEAGDDLVKKGVNLISRFGSAECGFLMSSHRHYDKDQAWSYLRSRAGMEKVKFEKQDDGLAELVVLQGWPHKAKTNREDGSFATADLFAAHSTIPNAWKYHSRADSQLTLITGKKFDPAPQESAIAHSDLLDDVLIFGNGRPFPGALLFRSEASKDMPAEELITQLAPLIEKLNSESQDHARIARNMLVVLDHSQNKLEKSSKGTILRNKAEETYASEIENAYTGLSASLSEEVADNEVATLLKEKIESIVSKGSLIDEDDLHSYGVDSVASIQIRYTLRQLLPSNSEEPPLSIVEDCGTVNKLAEYVISSRHGESHASGNDEDELMLMEELAEKYGNFEDLSDMPDVSALATKGNTNGSTRVTRQSTTQQQSAGDVILITGATGALGAHILHTYRSSPNVAHIYCLARGASSHAAHERVDKSLTSRGLPGLSSSSNTTSPQITVLQCNLSEPSLGLSNTDYAAIAHSVTHIVHLAWSVNFRMRLRSFAKEHLGGLRHLFLFALAASRSTSNQNPTRLPTLAFCSSIASVASAPTPVSETPSTDPNDSSPLGYARSKWVAERICALFVSQHPEFAAHVAAFRVGQLSGDSERGVWNMKEAWPLLLGSVRATGVLPDLGSFKSGEPLGWMPVDVAGRGMYEVIAGMNSSASKSGSNGMSKNDENAPPAAKKQKLTSTTTTTSSSSIQELQIYHLLNASAHPTWADLLTWAQRHSHPPFKLLPPHEWIQRMEALQQERPEYPALKLLGLWRDAYGEGKGKGGDGEGEAETGGGGKSAVQFATERAESMAPSLQEGAGAGGGKIDEVYFERVWDWIMRNVEE